MDSDSILAGNRRCTAEKERAGKYWARWRATQLAALAVGLLVAVRVPGFVQGTANAVTGASSATVPQLARGSMMALDVATGRRVWVVRARGQRIYGNPVADDQGRLFVDDYIGSCNGGPRPSRVAAFDTKAGREIWHTTANPTRQLFTDPAGSGVVVVEADLEVDGLDAKSGTRRWKIASTGDFPGLVPTPKLVLREKILPPVAGPSGFQSRMTDLRAFDRRTGTLRWTFQPSGIQLNGPFVLGADDQTIVLTNFDVLDARTGRLRLHLDGRASAHPGPQPYLYARVAGSAILAFDLGGMASYDATTGALRWAQSVSAPQFALRGGAAFVLSGGDVKRVDIGSGAVRWTTAAALPGTAGASVAVLGAGSGVVVIQRGSVVTALNAQTGKPRWSVASIGALNNDSVAFTPSRVILTGDPGDCGY